MHIPEEAIKKGKITIYADTDYKTVRAAEEHNRHMSECRIKRKRMQELEYGYLIFNLVIVVGLPTVDGGKMFSDPLVSIVILLANAAAYFIFAVMKRNFLISTIFTALLMVLDLRFGILTAVDVVLFLIHKRFDKELRAEPGYPLFQDILIKYEKSNAPVQREE
ncbi:MAG: hypothetical protein J1E39_03840 [Eubacterium sp.]|nr:hypothetical protein [Eubacterium sp.]